MASIPALAENAGAFSTLGPSEHIDVPCDTSELIEVAVTDEGLTLADMSDDFVFAASVASFGMLLRDSPYKGDSTLEAVEESAKESSGDDPYGYRAEFVELVGRARRIHDQLP